MMKTYIIERVIGETVVAVLKVEKDRSFSWLRPTYDGYNFATKFRERTVAERTLAKAAVSNKVGSLRIAPDYGIYTQGTKATVQPLPAKRREPHHR